MSDREKIQRALDYPYRTPGRSFLQVGEETRELQLESFAAEGRVPVLALGSNASPEVLDRKFSDDLGTVPTPVIRARLRDFDIVYSAHISAYGSIPAALQASPGTVVSTHVTYLTAEQLRVMTKTEPNYDLMELEGVSCQLETGVELSSIASYMSKHGCLSVEGGEVALAGIAAEDRRFPAWSEEEAIEHARSRLSPDQGLEDFIAENVASPETAKERTAILRESAKRFAGDALPFYGY